MIPVRRGAEPEALRDERFWRLARALLHHLKHGERPPENALTGYTCAKEALLPAQGNKCAYCEMWLREGGDVEHFRAKSVYFWLTWSWSNLFVACSTCNDPGRKGSRFDLFDPSARLRPGEEPPGNEQPKLLDPGDHAVNPLHCIEYKRLGERWQPVARGRHPRGEETIRAFGLDRGPLLDHYRQHVENLQPRIDAVHQAISAGDAGSVKARWEALVRNAFSRTQAFQGLMHDVLAAEFPEPVRAQWGLSLREPGDGLPPDPPARDREVAAHKDLPALLALKVRALGNRHDPAERDALILDLCAHRPHTCAELAAVLEREARHLQGVLKRLAESGRLHFTGQCYHAPRQDVSD